MTSWTGQELPKLVTSIPGPKSQAWVDDLARTECAAITARRARRAQETGVGQDPIVWERALGANVEDVDGNVFVDLTSAFAVCGLGHGHPEVVAAAHAQLDRLVHAMGDVYPSRVKIELGQALAQVCPPGLEQSILGLSGASAIEAALKTAAVVTGKPGVLSFFGGYHGLSYGALGVSGYRRSFRAPFMSQLNPFVHHVPYPDPYRPPFGLGFQVEPERVGQAVLAHVEQLLTHPASGAEALGAILVEPIQGRGGYVEAPPGFLSGLRRLCDAHGLVLIFDEIYTGLGRTGAMFACDHEGVVPDVLCVGKALGGGSPISAAVGKPHIMQAWGDSSGEAVHTSTFLGNPLGCAMAVASLRVLTRERWPERVAAMGLALRERLEQLRRDHPHVVGQLRGRGLMQGLELVQDVALRTPNGHLGIALMDECLKRGYLVLPTGTHGHVLAICPPFTITQAQLDGFWEALDQGLTRLAR